MVSPVGWPLLAIRDFHHFMQALAQQCRRAGYGLSLRRNPQRIRKIWQAGGVVAAVVVLEGQQSPFAMRYRSLAWRRHGVSCNQQGPFRLSLNGFGCARNRDAIAKRGFDTSARTG